MNNNDNVVNTTSSETEEEQFVVLSAGAAINIYILESLYFFYMFFIVFLTYKMIYDFWGVILWIFTCAILFFMGFVFYCVLLGVMDTSNMQSTSSEEHDTIVNSSPNLSLTKDEI